MDQSLPNDAAGPFRVKSGACRADEFDLEGIRLPPNGLETLSEVNVEPLFFLEKKSRSF